MRTIAIESSIHGQLNQSAPSLCADLGNITEDLNDRETVHKKSQHVLHSITRRTMGSRWTCHSIPDFFTYPHIAMNRKACCKHCQDEQQIYHEHETGDEAQKRKQTGVLRPQRRRDRARSAGAVSREVKVRGAGGAEV